MGKTASGKTTIVNELVSKYKYKQIITYTTRSPRKNEVQDITYHFISEEDFFNKIETNFFAEYKSYNTELGTWYYGTAMKDIELADKNTVIILTPDGYREIADRLPDGSKVIYIYANNATIKERLLERGDNKEEAQRRLEHDNQDFKGVENEVQKIFYNNSKNNIDDVVKKILDWIERR